MSFCIVGSRKKNNFEIRKYWEKTEKSSVLRQSVMWSFPSEVIDAVEKEIERLDGLKEYKFLLENILKEKPHVLSEKEATNLHTLFMQNNLKS